MIMAIPPYIGLSVSILNNNQNPYIIPEKEMIDTRVTEMKKTNGSVGDESLTLMPKKRSFDVAFLISPDDSKQVKTKKLEIEAESPSDLVVQTCESETIKSAFRKVGLGFVPSPLGESRSPSPIDTIRTPSPYSRPKGAIIPETLKPSPLHQQQQQQQHQDVQKKESFQQYANPIGQRQKFQSYQKEHLDKSAIFLGNNLISPVSVGSLARQNFIPAPIFAGNPILPASFVNPASLLPPSLAALTLPAQNVCAKCNVSFRMTSDLVYHMRSHHKNDHASADHLRRRREMDKLKCPVCNESFRERHHLTRHMTAHQDKEGDNIDGGIHLRAAAKAKNLENSKLSREYDP